MGDSDSYWSLALTVAQGKPYEYGVEPLSHLRTPGYPILLSPIAWCFGDSPNGDRAGPRRSCVVGHVGRGGRLVVCAIAV